jgi:Asp/Glu/hydantoin racemase
LKVLLLNPNTTAEVTQLLVGAAAGVANPDTDLVAITAPRGVPYISTRAEAQIGGALALEMLAEHHRTVDAAIIAAFGDPGLLGARELFPLPVIGMAEAAMLTACMLGRRFSIVTFASALGPWYEDCVAVNGLAGRCAGVRALTTPFNSIANVQEEKIDHLVALAREAVERDAADVCILSGAPLAGLAYRIADRIPVPLVDPIGAAVKQAEALVALRPRKATAGTFRRPDAKPSTGLPPALDDWLRHASTS